MDKLGSAFGVAIALGVVILFACHGTGAILTEVATSIGEGKAAAIRADGERAISYAAADAVRQGNEAIAADRRAAHGQAAWPWLVTLCFIVWIGRGVLVEWLRARQIEGRVQEPPTKETFVDGGI